MADFVHMKNLIQGEVIRITERRPLEERPRLLGELMEFLSEQSNDVAAVADKAAGELWEKGQ